MPSWSEPDDLVRFPIWFVVLVCWFRRPGGRAHLFGGASVHWYRSARPGTRIRFGIRRFHSKGLVINLWRIHPLSAEKNARSQNAPRARSVRRQTPSSRVTIHAGPRSQRSRSWLAVRRNGRRISPRDLALRRSRRVGHPVAVAKANRRPPHRRERTTCHNPPPASPHPTRLCARPRTSCSAANPSTS